MARGRFLRMRRRRRSNCGMSRLRMATPPGTRPEKISALASAIASILAKYSRWTGAIVGDDRDMRTHHGDQRRDFARMVHADFEHCRNAPVPACARASAARPSDCCRTRRRMGRPGVAQAPAQGLLGRGLADRTGHRDDPALLRLRAARARPSSAARTSRDDIKRPERPQRFGMRFVDHRRRGAFFERRGDVIMAVANCRP